MSSTNSFLESFLVNKNWSHICNSRTFSSLFVDKTKKLTWFSFVYFHTVFQQKQSNLLMTTIPFFIITFQSFVKQKQFSLWSKNKTFGKEVTSYTTLERRSIQYMKPSIMFFSISKTVTLFISNIFCMLSSDKSNNFRYFGPYGTWAKCHCVLYACNVMVWCQLSRMRCQDVHMFSFKSNSGLLQPSFLFVDQVRHTKSGRL